MLFGLELSPKPLAPAAELVCNAGGYGSRPRTSFAPARLSQLPHAHGKFGARRQHRVVSILRDQTDQSRLRLSVTALNRVGKLGCAVGRTTKRALEAPLLGAQPLEAQLCEMHQLLPRLVGQ